MEPNRLVHEKSPYLRQHAYNPVDWHPWSDAVFKKAVGQDKPVFLSIGYATCHWCHVMEKESFEDRETAALLNDTFICIKVDREERPDIDAVYMAACQMMNRSCGWPLTVLMTPEKQPFFVATYMPRKSRFGSVGVMDLCRQVKNLWDHKRDQVVSSAADVMTHLGRAFSYSSGDDVSEDIFHTAFAQIEKSFDARYGGFEGAPKFPTPHRLLFILRYARHHQNDHARDMVVKTLKAMRNGGIWDHVGFGFHRYSTDVRWFLPHFEKMLYDQSLLASAYLDAFQVTGDEIFAQTARDIFTYVQNEMTSVEGGFYAAEDADSEGEEGKFYVWSLEEFRDVLGEKDAGRWASIYGLTAEGNFLEEATRQKTGRNILHLTQDLAEWAKRSAATEQSFYDQWQTLRGKLLQRRQQRVRPLKDDKIMVDWNGLMIAALAKGARILDHPEYTRMAVAAADFLLSKLMDKKGRLLHRFREDEAGIQATANDYAFFVYGLIALYETTLDLGYLQHATALMKQMIQEFWDNEQGGFFLNSAEDNDLPARPKEIYDGAIPSANSVSLFNLFALYRMTGDSKWDDRARDIVKAFSGTVTHYPSAYTFFLTAMQFRIYQVQEIVIAGRFEHQKTQAMLRRLNRQFHPGRTVLLKTPQNANQLSMLAPFTSEMKAVDDETPTAYICSNFSCRRPVTDMDEFEKLINIEQA